MDYRPLAVEEREKLTAALRRNVDGNALAMNPKDTTFVGLVDDVDVNQMVNAIRSIPCHY